MFDEELLVVWGGWFDLVEFGFGKFEVFDIVFVIGFWVWEENIGGVLF